MRVILLGPPGAGKGTQAQFIKEHFKLPQVSTGDILRQAIKAESKLGKKVQSIISTGALIPDELINEIVEERISQEDCKQGFLLDGYPRTVQQAKALAMTGIKLDAIIELDVPDEELIKRLTGRRIHPESGRVYHIDFHPPTRPGKDDVTGEPLIQREDDHQETVLKRLKVYRTETQPVVNYYMKLSMGVSKDAPLFFKIDGQQSALVICDQIFNRLSKFNDQALG